MEVKYDKQVNELKENQEQQLDQLKQSHVEETKNLTEKIDMVIKKLVLSLPLMYVVYF